MSASAESRQRFEREAKTISQLSHPHICALYDVGSEGDTEYLVMEYLEGETLGDRLGKGAMPLEQTLRYGVEIADALDKAHRQGIVHRDLKPGNVMITKSGVKLLDFGLAKAMAPAAQQSGLTSLPTVAGAANLTQAGTILGTFQYMSPEQLEGKEADARTDIFALGAVLYEMVTGRKAFSGTSQASLISAIMKEEPAPISGIQPMSPPALDRVVRTCLSKDPEDRWQSARDVANELKWIAEGSQAGVPTKVSARRRSRERVAWALAALATVAAAVLAVAHFRQTPDPVQVIRASIMPPEKTFIRDLALSPDGGKLAFTASNSAGQLSLWVRDLDAGAAHPIAGSEGARFPFWSPDGRFIAFFADGKLSKVEAGGGALLAICDADNGVGGTWNREGTIVFAPSPTAGLFRVSGSGGKAESLTRLDPARHEKAHRYPFFLPDGRHFLYMVASLGGAPGADSNVIRVGSLDGREDRLLVRAFSNAQYAAGRLLYVRDETLFAQSLDTSAWTVKGDPVAIEPRVVRTTDWAGFYAFSASRETIVFAPLFAGVSGLAWFDRSGKTVGPVGTPQSYGSFRLSPDERRVAATVLNASKNKTEIWTVDVASGAAAKLVAGARLAYVPIWSPDGSRVFFSSAADRSTLPSIWVKPMDGSKEQPYAESGDNLTPLDWSPDGRFLAVQKVPLEGKRYNELWYLTADDPKHQTPFATEYPNQIDARFAPDGKWLAYASDETGISEVYVRPFPGPGGVWKVSVAGGFLPQWRGDGKEMFYQSADSKLMAVPVALAPAFQSGTPVPLFSMQSTSAFEASRDGQRFLVNTVPEGSGSPPLSLLLNWTAIAEKK
jgi:Tol biopolymer transport system component/predicted Ser/Thr protein kinase